MNQADTMAMAAKARASKAFKSLIKSVTSSFRKSKNSMMLESLNPMWNISTREAQMIFDLARSGNYSKLQFIYHEIERTDPTLLVCVTRRAAALSELDWKVVRSDQRRNRGVDEKLVEEQISCLETEIAKLENLPEAVEHLALAAFRGYAHIAPIHSYDGSLKRFDILDNWNFCWDMEKKGWLWNPTASAYMSPKDGQNGLTLIPKGELVSVTDPRPIDWPGLKIFLRSSVSERDWGQFLETYGMPPVIITMPDMTSDDDAPKFMEGAKSIFEGRCGVLPYGSEVSWASESRGTNPFTEFIEHQQKLIVLMATGGLLTSLAESGSGTLAGDAHEDTWLQIVRRDVRKLSNSFNKMLCEGILKAKFPKQPVLAEFKLETERDPSPKEVFEIAGAAASAGYRIDVEEVAEQSGYKVTLIDQGGGMGGMGGDPGAGGSPDGGGDGEGPGGGEGETDGQPDDGGQEKSDKEKHLEGLLAELEKPDGGKEGDGEGDEGKPQEGVSNAVVTNAEKPKGPLTAAQKLAWSLQLDFKDVADRVNEILEMPEAERAEAAEKLMGELDSLVPEDPSMASVIAEEMAKAFGGVPGAVTETVEPKE